MRLRGSCSKSLRRSPGSIRYRARLSGLLKRRPLWLGFSSIHQTASERFYSLDKKTGADLGEEGGDRPAPLGELTTCVRYRVRDLNPCYRRERPASWTRLDERGFLYRKYQQHAHKCQVSAFTKIPPESDFGRAAHPVSSAAAGARQTCRSTCLAALRTCLVLV